MSHLFTPLDPESPTFQGKERSVSLEINKSPALQGGDLTGFIKKPRKVFQYLWFFNLFFVFASIFIFIPYFQSFSSFPNETSLKDQQVVLDLREQIKKLQKEIITLRESIIEYRNLERSLKNELFILENEIERMNLEIEKTDLAMLEIVLQIEAKIDEIQKIEIQIQKERGVLKEILQIIYEKEEEGLLEILLKNNNFSEFFSEVRYLENLQENLQISLNRVKTFKEELTQEKERLEEERMKNVELKILQMLQKSALEAKKEEKSKLLTESQGKESLFQELLYQAKEDIKEVRELLYTLEGFGVSIKFEEAYNLAKKVSQKTGVRPSLILAVLKQESNLGSFVGSGNWRDDMHPRDWSAFLEITQKLGLDPDTTPVSKKPSYGWGGAMGPAQFLPSTWLLYETRISQITGHNPPSPWDIEDAFAASAIKLAKDGASSGNRNDEWKAAMIYFAGRNWDDPRFSFYGDSVMDLADFFQKQIDLLK